jgi:endoglucanase
VLEATLQTPPVPTGLAAMPGNAQVQLNWNAASGATSYNVKRSTTSGGPYTTIAGVAGTSFSNTNLTNGTTYFYVVSAVNANGESANSSQVSATPVAANFTLSANPTSSSINRGSSGTSTITITRTGGFNASVAFTASGMPPGVTASFNPPSTTGASSTITLSASSTATLGPASITVTGSGGGLTRTILINLAVNEPAGGTGGLTITPVINASGPWFNEEALRLSNTANITALSITIMIQRTAGISFNGQYNTVGGLILQSNSSTSTTITYQFNLAPGQTLWPNTNWTFAAQMGGTGTVHPTAGDTWVVSYTTDGVTYSQTGHF